MSGRARHRERVNGWSAFVLSAGPVGAADGDGCRADPSAGFAAPRHRYAVRQESLTMVKYLIRFAFLVFLLGGAMPIWADEAGVAWSALEPAQQTLLHSFEEKWSQLPPERQTALARGSERWLAMSSEERQHAHGRFEHWQKLSPEQREQMRQRWREFRTLPPEEQERARAQFRRFREMPAEQREALKDRWHQLPPEERKALREQFHAGHSHRDDNHQ